MELNMSELQTRFEKAARDVQMLSQRPDNETMLRLYALYKQATLGDNSRRRPGFTDVAGRAKYDAWNRLKGMSTDEAMQEYIDMAEMLLKK
jgi:acyl-CoA-binding protein